MPAEISEARERMTPTRDRVDWDRLRRDYRSWREQGYWIQGHPWFGFDATHSFVDMELLLEAMVEQPPRRRRAERLGIVHRELGDIETGSLLANSEQIIANGSQWVSSTQPQLTLALHHAYDTVPGILGIVLSNVFSKQR